MLTKVPFIIDNVEISLLNKENHDLISFRAESNYHTSIRIRHSFVTRQFKANEIEIISSLIRKRVQLDSSILFENIDHLMRHLEEKYEM